MKINFWNKTKLFFENLFWGMKATEDKIFHQSGSCSDNTISITKEVEDNSVCKALLKGEVTQEVENLRYRTYLVDKEAKKMEYFSPTLAIKRGKEDKKFIKYDNSDNLELITSQSNDKLTESVIETLEHVGERGKDTEYRIKVKRNNIPRYKIEKYTTRIDVKKIDDDHAIIELYVSLYPNESDLTSKSFINELNRIKDGYTNSDILDIEELSFTSKGAYKVDDLTDFVFKNIFFKEIKEFDGHFILKFKSSFTQTANDLTKIYYSKPMDIKYKNKEKKELVFNFSDALVKEKYICQECGKEIVVDYDLFNSLEEYNGRDTTEEDFSDKPLIGEFIDYQISEQTIGKGLCTKCLKKYVENNKI